MAKYIINVGINEFPEGKMSKGTGRNMSIKDIFKNEFDMVSSGELMKAERLAETFMEYMKAGRVDSVVSKPELKKILIEYNLIKPQRNNANHASDDQTGRGNGLGYKETCRLLYQAADRIQKVLK